MTVRMCASPAFTSAVASDTQVAEANTEITGDGNSSATIRKIFGLPPTHIPGNTYRIKAQMKNALGLSYVSVLYILDEFDNLLSTISTSSTNYVEVTGDITLTSGNAIKISILGHPSSTAYAKDVKLCCTETGQTTTWATGAEL